MDRNLLKKCYNWQVEVNYNSKKILRGKEYNGGT